MLLACGVLLIDLGAGEWRTWDEGLYGRLARNALEHDRYLHAVDDDGAFYRRFSKPPMSLWLAALSLDLFGISVASLRLPFALGMLATIGFAFGWGRRIGGLGMGTVWALGLVSCAATTRWGRHACIEPLFMAGLIGGLWAYHESMVAETRGAALKRAALAGVALAFALLTKQLAVGLAVLPILVLEAWRRDRTSAPRLALALGIPAVVGGAWFVWAGVATDGAVFDILVDRGIRRRMAGFARGQNARTMGELASVVTEACHPVPWALGAAGLALLAVSRPRVQLRSPGPDVLLPLWFAGNVVVLDNLSASMLPWYALHIVVPALGGAAWLVAATTARSGRAPLRRARAGLGWACAGLVGIEAASTLASQFNVALIAGVVLVVGFVRRPDAVRAAALAAVGLLMLGNRLRDPELNPPDQPFAPLMAALAAHPRVAVDRRAGLAQLASKGLYGPHAVEVKVPPWPTTEYDAYLTPLVVPVEYAPPEGITVHRSAGATAFVGDLTQPAWTRSSLAQLLGEGPVTFEAEHLAATGWDTTVGAPEASGGQLRRYSLFRNEAPPKLPLSIGPQISLPAGRYTLEVWMRWRCPEGSGDRAAAVIVAATEARDLLRRSLSCEDAPDGLTPVRFEFELRGAERFNMRVAYRYGTVAHDRTVFTRGPLDLAG